MGKERQEPLIFEVVYAPFEGMDKPWTEAEKQELCKVLEEIFKPDTVDKTPETGVNC